MLALAKEVKNLSTFSHVSTCYVNCTRSGPIAEEIYDMDKIDVEQYVKGIMSMTKEQADKAEANILGNFPNTYTFTKNLSEKALFKNKGNLNVCLVRPAIIASSLKEPFPGWTDTLSAAGGITLLTGIGLIHYIEASGKNRFDVTPVDLVTNHIIVGTAFAPMK